MRLAGGMWLLLAAAGCGGAKKGECTGVAACARSCESGEGYACANLGVYHDPRTKSRPAGARDDGVLAVDYYLRGCDRQFAPACTQAAHLLADGRGVKADPERARRLYRRACDRYDPPACNSLGIMLENGQGGAADFGEASKLYLKACQSQHANGCFNLGLWYDTASNAEAAAEYERACKLGNERGCEEAKAAGARANAPPAPPAPAAWTELRREDLGFTVRLPGAYEEEPAEEHGWLQFRTLRLGVIYRVAFSTLPVRGDIDAVSHDIVDKLKAKGVAIGMNKPIELGGRPGRSIVVVGGEGSGFLRIFALPGGRWIMQMIIERTGKYQGSELSEFYDSLRFLR